MATLELQDALTQLLSNLGAATRRKAMREIGSYLMRSNRKRIRQNIQPGGDAMAKRKQGGGRMFRKIGRQMKNRSSTDAAEVGFYGRTGWVASNHQLGRMLRRKDYMIDFPVRELLGLDDEDRQTIRNILLKYIGAGLPA